MYKMSELMSGTNVSMMTLTDTLQQQIYKMHIASGTGSVSAYSWDDMLLELRARKRMAMTCKRMAKVCADPKTAKTILLASEQCLGAFVQQCIQSDKVHQLCVSLRMPYAFVGWNMPVLEDTRDQIMFRYTCEHSYYECIFTAVLVNLLALGGADSDRTGQCRDWECCQSLTAGQMDTFILEALRTGNTNAHTVLLGMAILTLLCDDDYENSRGRFRQYRANDMASKDAKYRMSETLLAPPCIYDTSGIPPPRESPRVSLMGRMPNSRFGGFHAPDLLCLVIVKSIAKHWDNPDIYARSCRLLDRVMFKDSSYMDLGWLCEDGQCVRILVTSATKFEEMQSQLPRSDRPSGWQYVSGSVWKIFEHMRRSRNLFFEDNIHLLTLHKHKFFENALAAGASPLLLRNLDTHIGMLSTGCENETLVQHLVTNVEIMLTILLQCHRLHGISLDGGVSVCMRFLQIKHLIVGGAFLHQFTRYVIVKARKVCMRMLFVMGTTIPAQQLVSGASTQSLAPTNEGEAAEGYSFGVCQFSAEPYFGRGPGRLMLHLEPEADQNLDVGGFMNARDIGFQDWEEQPVHDDQGQGQDDEGAQFDIENVQTSSTDSDDTPLFQDRPQDISMDSDDSEIDMDYAQDQDVEHGGTEDPYDDETMRRTCQQTPILAMIQQGLLDCVLEDLQTIPWSPLHDTAESNEDVRQSYFQFVQTLALLHMFLICGETWLLLPPVSTTHKSLWMAWILMAMQHYHDRLRRPSQLTVLNMAVGLLHKLASNIQQMRMVSDFAPMLQNFIHANGVLFLRDLLSRVTCNRHEKCRALARSINAKCHALLRVIAICTASRT